MRPRSAVLLAVAVALAPALAACGGSDDSSSSAEPTVTCSYESADSPAKPVSAPPSEPKYNGTVPFTMATNVGTLKGTLDGAKAPCAVNAVASLADQGYYDDTTCHRLATAPASQTSKGFHIIQCGDPLGNGTGGPGFRYDQETTGSEDYRPGSIAMANTGQPGSTGAQFFIDYDVTDLAPAYTQIGQLDEASLKLVQKAAKAATEGITEPYDGPMEKPLTISKIVIGS